MNEHIAVYLARHEVTLQTYMQELVIPATRLKEAIQHSLFPGGKRFRPLLVYLTGELTQAPLEALDVIAASIELSHCFSLVHDDLPAMDNDDYRRGKLSCHKAFDEATAILAGDGMQTLAVDLLLTKLQNTLNPQTIITITHTLLKAAGIQGMLSGQCLDLTELTSAVSDKRLREIHRLKTGCIIEACIKCAILAGELPEKESVALQQFANQLGLLFQMQDDYLDQYAPHTLGKNRSSDLINQKTTFATRYTQDALRKLIDAHYQHLEETLYLFQGKEQILTCFIKNSLNI